MFGNCWSALSMSHFSTSSFRERFRMQKLEVLLAILLELFQSRDIYTELFVKIVH